MAARKGSRRDFITLQAIDPRDGSLACEVLISYDRMQAVGKRSMGHAKECAFIVPMILQRPTAVFEGLRWDEDEDRSGYGWRCYCGVPDRAYHVDGRQRPPYPGQVYLVFVNDEGVAYNWRWEKADPHDRKLPVGHDERFRQKLL
jgi:hypothetical protein